MIQILIDRFLDWLDGIGPVACSQCAYIMPKRVMKWHLTTMGQNVPLCPDCDLEIFGGVR